MQNNNCYYCCGNIGVFVGGSIEIERTFYPICMNCTLNDKDYTTTVEGDLS